MQPEMKTAIASLRPASPAPEAPLLNDHPQRYALTNELHARPPVSLQAPARVYHLAVLYDGAARGSDRDHLLALCDRFGVEHPHGDASHFIADFGRFVLKWERHTEFCGLTIFARRAPDQRFESSARGLLPGDWLVAFPGQVIAAVNVVIDAAEDLDAEVPELWQEAFSPDSVSGGQIGDAEATVWGDFRIHEDGASRFLLRIARSNPASCGRMVQRLIEIETYRSLALLAFPVARSIGMQLSPMEARLTQLTAAMTSDEPAAQRQLLTDLTGLAAGFEQLAAEHSYRLSAARAYYAIVNERIASLREVKLPGQRTIAGFMEVRLAPAMRTCSSVEQRIRSLSERVKRAGNLLRTRVDVTLEEQNRDLLMSMERRARVQLRLQETVEGLSVIAISYYGVGLLSYLFEAIKDVLPVAPKTAAGLAAPLVVLIVWTSMRRMHSRLMKGERDG